jgi:hypothetical protein
VEILAGILCGWWANLLGDSGELIWQGYLAGILCGWRANLAGDFGGDSVWVVAGKSGGGDSGDQI